MNFVRLIVSHTRGGEVIAVMSQDTPFDKAMIRAEGEDCEALDFGLVEEGPKWSRLDGRPCSVDGHIFDRVKRGSADSSGVPKALDCPCTIEGIKKRLRERGPDGIPVKARAWLANILPEHQATAMGLWRGLPVSALKAAEALRNRRDPQGGSRMEYLNSIAQRQSDSHAASRLRARKKKEAKASG